MQNIIINVFDLYDASLVYGFSKITAQHCFATDEEYVSVAHFFRHSELCPKLFCPFKSLHIFDLTDHFI